jgi:hypothetical protein
MEEGDGAAATPGASRRFGALHLLLLLLPGVMLVVLEAPFKSGRRGGLMWTTPRSRADPWVPPLSLSPTAEPWRACGVDYRTLVEGGANASVLPVCTRQQLEEEATSVYRAGDGGHVQFADCRLRWFNATVGRSMHL